MPCSHVHLVGVARTLETQSQRALWLSSPRLKNSNISSVFFLLRCPKASLKSLYTHSILEVFHNFCSFSERRPGSPLHWDAVTERRKSFSFSAILPSNLQQLSCCQERGCGFGGWCGEVGTVWGHAAGWGRGKQCPVWRLLDAAQGVTQDTHESMARCLLHAESSSPPTILRHCSYCQVSSGIFIVLYNYYTAHQKFS